MIDIFDAVKKAIHEGNVKTAVSVLNTWSQTNELEIGVADSIESDSLCISMMRTNHCLDESRMLIAFYHAGFGSQIYGRLGISLIANYRSVLRTGRTCPNGSFDTGWLKTGTKFKFNLELADTNDWPFVNLAKRTKIEIPTSAMGSMTTAAKTSDIQNSDIEYGTNQFGYEILQRQKEVSIYIPAKVGRNGFGVVLIQAIPKELGVEEADPMLLAIGFSNDGIHESRLDFDTLFPNSESATDDNYRIKIMAEPTQILAGCRLEQIVALQEKNTNLSVDRQFELSYFIESKRLFDAE